MLTDGTGAFIFLKSIVTHYLVERYRLTADLIPEERSSVGEKSRGRKKTVAGAAVCHEYSGTRAK